jgi:hypothetical protein
MFRFTIRDLMWLTLLVAVACGGVVNTMELARRFVAECDSAWRQISASAPPLMGRESVVAGW